jgi:hypothetical protein
MIRAMMEAARTSETPVHSDVTTRRYIPEDSKLHTRRRENLTSHRVTATSEKKTAEIFVAMQDCFVV